MQLLLGKCEDKLKELPDNSVDSVVTDPPYGLSAAKNSGNTSKGGFMGKNWDYDVPSVEQWKEVYRVLKPGGYLLSFAGTRTQHRMAVNIEDAGFEIRDMIAWVFGSGFPKSLNIGKVIDKQQGNKREVVKTRISAFGDAGESETGDGRNLWKKPATKEVVVDKGFSPHEGWGTALKPALEPITMARKPLGENTVASNVLKWGTGGINIDESRVSTDGEERDARENNISWGISRVATENDIRGNKAVGFTTQGRFPANLIHDGSDEVTSLFPDNTGAFAPVRSGMSGKSNGIYGDYAEKGDDGKTYYNDIGNASRFFYCAKASKSDRHEGLDEFEDNYILNEHTPDHIIIEIKKYVYENIKEAVQ